MIHQPQQQQVQRRLIHPFLSLALSLSPLSLSLPFGVTVSLFEQTCQRRYQSLPKTVALTLTSVLFPSYALGHLVTTTSHNTNVLQPSMCMLYRMSCLCHVPHNHSNHSNNSNNNIKGTNN